MKKLYYCPKRDILAVRVERKLLQFRDENYLFYWLTDDWVLIDNIQWG